MTTNVPQSAAMRCEHRELDDKGKRTRRCSSDAMGFVTGMWRCRGHLPTGSSNCGHSISMNNWCSYCGAPIEPEAAT